MADVRLAPPLQRLTSPPEGAPVPPPPPLLAPAAPRLSAPPVVHREPSTGSIPAVTFQDLLGTKADPRPVKRKKKRGKKLFSFLVLVGLLGGGSYAFRNSQPIQHLLGHKSAAAPLPAQPFVRPTLTSAEFMITLSAVQNGVPNNVTTKVRADYLTGTGETTVESQVGGVFTTSKEIHTADYLYRAGDAQATTWSRQPRTPDTPSSIYDAAAFVPMVNDIIDQPLRDGMQPTTSTSERVGDATISSVTYVIDRARVPEVAPAIFARVPWLFDVPNATTLTAVISYDESGLIRHLDFRVDPPQPGTGIDATWVTSYALDVTSLNSPVVISVPVDAPADVPVDVPVATP